MGGYTSTKQSFGAGMHQIGGTSYQAVAWTMATKCEPDVPRMTKPEIIGGKAISGHTTRTGSRLRFESFAEDACSFPRILDNN